MKGKGGEEIEESSRYGSTMDRTIQKIVEKQVNS